VERLREGEMTVDLKALKQEARSKRTSVARLIELAALDPKVSREIARSKYTPVQVLEHLTQSSDVHTREAIIYHPAVTPALLEKLSSDGKERVLRAVAFHDLTPSTALGFLARHPQASVRSVVAKNSQVPQSLKERFADDPDSEVRRAIARSAALPVDIIQRLLVDPAPEVRAAALSNPHTGFERRLAALDDRDGGVRSFALWRLKDDALSGKVVAFDVLERLARDVDTDVRESVAMYVRWGLPKSPERDVLADQLSRDENEKVRFHAQWTLKGACP